ncbi:MAG: flagellar motor switch protein FliN [Candidatus Marinamargulisbacteria bacterium]
MNDEKFNDPLADFDPVMASAFSTESDPLSEAQSPPVASDTSSDASKGDGTDSALNTPLDDFIESAPAPNNLDAAPAAPATPQNSEPPTTDSDDLFFDDDSFDIDETLFETSPEKDSEGVQVSNLTFDAPTPPSDTPDTYDKNIFKNIKVDVAIELGRTKISLKKLYELKNGAIVEMGRLVGEPLDLVINDQVIARGEVVAVNNNYGIRITHVEATNPIT